MKTRTLSLITLTVLAGQLPPVNATTVNTVLASYTSTSSTSNPTLAPDVQFVSPAIDADPLSAGNSITANSGDTWNWKGWDTASRDSFAALDAGDYWTWGFQVQPAWTVSPSTLDIRFDRSGSGPDDVEILARVNDKSFVQLLNYDFNDSGSGVDVRNVDLTTLGRLGAGDAVAFYLAAFNSESAGGTFDLENLSEGSGLIMYGDVENVSAVPLPAAFPFFLSAVALLGVIGRQRSGKGRQRGRYRIALT